jgi:hypothetical protein
VCLLGMRVKITSTLLTPESLLPQIILRLLVAFDGTAGFAAGTSQRESQASFESRPYRAWNNLLNHPQSWLKLQDVVQFHTEWQVFSPR